MESVLRAPSQAGQILRSARQHRHLSQNDLAGKCHVSQSTLSKIEQGLASVTVEQFLSFCANLDLEVVVRPMQTGGHPLPSTAQPDW